MAGRKVAGFGTGTKRALHHGDNAFDRLARAMKGRPPEDVAAAELLRRSRLRLARISSQIFEDLVTGETFTLLSTPFSDEIGDGVAFGLFTTIVVIGVLKSCI